MAIIKGALGWFIGNPIYIVIALALAFFTYQYIENKSLKASNANLRGEISQVKVDQENTMANVDRIDTIQGQIAGTRNTQTIIRERVNNVPVLAEDRPFVNDPALLDRADIVRDYQQSYSPPVKPSSQR